MSISLSRLPCAKARSPASIRPALAQSLIDENGGSIRDWIMLVYTHPQITTDRCEARDQKHELRRDATGSIKCPSQFSATKIAAALRMAGSTARCGCVHRLASPSHARAVTSFSIYHWYLRCPSTPCRW